MFISHVTSKGRQYIYLYEYCSSETKKKQSLYGFGRKEEAIKDMRIWRRNFNLFPEKLVEFGCTKKDLVDWIKTMETGVTKTGKKFKAIV